MKQTSFLWQALGFAVATFGGTVLHFLYGWTGESLWAAPFSGINESTWEHMKLLFWPLFLFALCQRPFFRGQKRFWCVKLAEILLGLLLIPVLFYTWNGAFGQSPGWVNIAIFYLSAAAVFLFERRALQADRLPCGRPSLALTALFAVAALFVLFTFAPPQLPLFRDPLTPAGSAFSHENTPSWHGP